ncbi:hypothetical protein ACUR5C_00110 [Aliikangiella sp. IMCC44653]
MDNRLLKIISLIMAIGLVSTAAADPTRPKHLTVPKKQVNAKKGSANRAALTAIIFRDDQRLAIIGEKTYREGDMFFESKIIRINRKYVTLRSAKGEYRLTLFGNVKSKQ